MNESVSIPTAPPPPTPQQQGASGQAIAALILGILSFLGFGPLTGIPAYILGRAEEKAIAAGRSSPAGQSMATVGKILGLVATLLTLVALIVIFFFTFFFLQGGRTTGHLF